MAGETKNLGKYAIDGGPGRPKGAVSGRAQALAILDRVLGKEKNKKLLEKAFQEMFEKSPMAFFMKVVAPLMPKEIRLDPETFPRGFIIVERDGKDDSGKDGN